MPRSTAPIGSTEFDTLLGLPLNVSSDGTFAAIDAVNANVTGMQLFTWSGGTAGGHYAARIVADGAALGRRISNVVDIVR